MLNQFCQVDYKFKTWACCICAKVNNFPVHYANNISPQSLPFELMPDYSTLEYILPPTMQQNMQQSPTIKRPIFMLVIDTAVASEELVELKDSLQQSINFIPQDALIGLITYGKMVQVHELGFADCPKCFVFRGDKALNSKQIQEQLDLKSSIDPMNKDKADPAALAKFLVPISECEFALNSIIDDL